MNRVPLITQLDYRVDLDRILEIRRIQKEFILSKPKQAAKYFKKQQPIMPRLFLLAKIQSKNRKLRLNDHNIGLFQNKIENLNQIIKNQPVTLQNRLNANSCRERISSYQQTNKNRSLVVRRRTESDDFIHKNLDLVRRWTVTESNDSPSPIQQKSFTFYIYLILILSNRDIVQDSKP
ncbi:hypothetical protein pb186bvf_004022 [Paramecium bursaria]